MTLQHKLTTPKPFDDSDSEGNVISDSQSGGEGSDTEKDSPKSKHEPERHLKDPFRKSRQATFACMQKHDGNTKDSNPNAHTIEVLQKMADYYERMKDHWRTTAYRKAIGALRLQTRKITTKEEAAAIPSIGNRLADKIEEIVCTNKLRRLENTALETNDEALQTFLNVYGVGYRQAQVWLSCGHRTLDDLKTKAKLSKNQAIGVDHYHDFLACIPRDEVERHGHFVRSTIASVCPLLEVTIGGSYRRGAKDSGDVDFIVTAPETPLATLRTLFLEELIPRLFEDEYLKCTLADTSATGTKWHGAACLPGSSPAVWRRVDFLLVPHDEWGAALLYFTGNDIFNRSIRLLARKKGLRLNQHGLFKDVMRGPGGLKVNRGSLLEAKSEERIFELLGVPWRPPEHRIC